MFATIDVLIQHMNLMIMNISVMIKFQQIVIILAQLEKYLNYAILNVKFATQKEMM